MGVVQAPESCVGDSQAHSRGLRVTFSWLVKPKTLTGEHWSGTCSYVVVCAPARVMLTIKPGHNPHLHS